MIKKLFSSIKLTLRVIKNLILRPFRVVRNRVTYFFNAGRLVTKLPGVAHKLPKILRTKPEKREDYFDWGTVYVAKSLVILLVVLLIAIPLLCIFVVAPLVTSWWGVKRFHMDDAKLDSYRGRVCIYYDTEWEDLKFEGRLKKGEAIDYGEEYYSNGRIAYAGDYVEGLYEGDGILYYEDGTVKYRGEFVKGRYQGEGEYYAEDGLVYIGTFDKGLLTGDGTVMCDEVLLYEGAFEKSTMQGEGKMYYPSGTVQYKGLFQDGLPDGLCMEYYESGNLKYRGDFLAGVYHGSGTLYSEQGEKLYAGAFENGCYSGDGILYTADGLAITGTFAKGVLIGAGHLTYANGMTYEGCFIGAIPNGVGILSDLLGQFTYMGVFRDGDIDHVALLGQEVSGVREQFSEKLTQILRSDGFYLSNKSYGITLNCRYAEGDSLAMVSEVVSRVSLSPQGQIRSAADIMATGADTVAETAETLPAWIADMYGIDAESVVGYAAQYGTSMLYFWVERDTGALVLKHAIGPAATEDDATSVGG